MWPWTGAGWRKSENLLRNAKHWVWLCIDVGGNKIEIQSEKNYANLIFICDIWVFSCSVLGGIKTNALQKCETSMVSNAFVSMKKKINKNEQTKRTNITPRDCIYNGIKLLLFIADQFLFWLEDLCTNKNGNGVNRRDWYLNSVAVFFFLWRSESNWSERERKEGKKAMTESLSISIVCYDCNGFRLFTVLSWRKLRKSKYLLMIIAFSIAW